MTWAKPLAASLGLLMLASTALVQAAPGDQDHQGPGGQPQHAQGQGQQHNGQAQQQHQPQQRQPDQQQRPQQNASNGQRPPADFGPIRQTIQQHRDSFGRGNPPPANIQVMKGHPLPRGYGRRLDSRALAHLPQYPGYEWRRLGTDVVLVALGTGLVYEILQGVLN